MKECCFLVVLIVIPIAMTAQEIITDRPDQTESSTTIPSKSFQFETGIVLENNRHENLAEQALLIPTTLLRYGLNNIIELRLGEQLTYLKNKHTFEDYFGLSDTELGFKIQLLRDPAINSEIAFISHLIIPTGASGITNNKIGTLTKVAISHSITDFIDLGYNVGYTSFCQAKGDLTYSVAVGFGLTSRIGTYCETYGEFAGLHDLISNFDAGFIYLIKNFMQFDCSFGLGLNQKMNYFSIGYSMNISK